MAIQEYGGTVYGIEVWERWDSRDASSGKSNALELSMIANGTADEVEAIIAVQNFTPSILFGLVRDATSAKRIGHYLWECKVSYADADKQDKDPPVTGDGLFTFDTGGGSTHINTAYEQKGYALTGTVSEFFGAINVQGEGANQKVEGVDVVIPSLTFERTHYLDIAYVTLPYVKTLARITGRTNNAAWFGFAEGELLFLGASGSLRPPTETSPHGDWEIKFSFDASENITNLRVGANAAGSGGITVTSKKGHDYLWVRFQSTDDTTAKTLVQKPIEAFVARVYESADFTQLGIGS